MNRRVPMKDFLQHLGAGDEALGGCNQAFQNNLRLHLMRMRGSNQVHRNVGIDKYQPSYPRSISLNICLTSAVGK
jgi:hypothetical protein